MVAGWQARIPERAGHLRAPDTRTAPCNRSSRPRLRSARAASRRPDRGWPTARTRTVPARCTSSRFQRSRQVADLQGRGAQPMWSRDGRELFYTSGNRIMVVPVEAGATFEPGTARVLFEIPLPERGAGGCPAATRFLPMASDSWC